DRSGLLPASMTAKRPTSERTLVERATAHRRSLRWREALIGALLRVCAFSAVAGLLLIMLFVFKEALPILTDPETQKEASVRAFFASPLWQPVGTVPKYGIVPLLTGTLKVVLVALGFSVPVGVLAAVFASEFAPPRVREMLKPVVEILAGIPSVVLGFFALIVMATWIQSVT